MQATDSPAVGRRRLAQELRRLRSAAGLTITDVAGRLECSAGKISRIETGEVGAQATDVRAMLDLYGVSGTQRDTLGDLVRLARRRAWWQDYADVVPAGSGRFFGLEDGAVSIDQHAGPLVPGLLQTPAYARAVISVARRRPRRRRRAPDRAAAAPPATARPAVPAAAARAAGRGRVAPRGRRARGDGRPARSAGDPGHPGARRAAGASVRRRRLPGAGGGVHGVRIRRPRRCTPGLPRAAHRQRAARVRRRTSSATAAAFAESADRGPGSRPASADLLRALRP